MNIKKNDTVIVLSGKDKGVKTCEPKSQGELTGCNIF